MKLERHCKKCEKLFPIENFHLCKRGKHGRRAVCRSCCNAMIKEIGSRDGMAHRKRFLQRLRRMENREHILKIERKSRKRDWPGHLKKCREYYAKLRKELFEAYGNKCACCGETHREFFAVDHINGGGTSEKKKIGTRPLYLKIRAEGFPKDKYQILCHNCNMSIGFYGYCPHHPEKIRPLHRPQKPKFIFHDS